VNNSNLITTHDLVKTFAMGNHEFTALNEINLVFKTGEFAGVVGPSGSGKTTLLNIYPYSGRSGHFRAIH
jgi:putative ABC transport system ATP-binding protein